MRLCPAKTSPPRVGVESLQQQAQRWARDCVEQAQRDAEAIHAQAFRKAMPTASCAHEHLANGLLESQALGQQLRSDLAQSARDLLADALNRPEWLDEMFERWLTDNRPAPGAVLQVLLPMHCRPQGNELRERLSRLWPGELVLDYHPQERYVVRLRINCWNSISKRPANDWSRTCWRAWRTCPSRFARWTRPRCRRSRDLYSSFAERSADARNCPDRGAP